MFKSKPKPIARLVLTQAGHVERWRAIRGMYYIIQPGERPILQFIGEGFDASILAVRQTALLVKEPFSKEAAAETNHDPASKRFRQIAEIANRGAAAFYAHYGPEVLMYIHGKDVLATLLFSSKPAKGVWESTRRTLAAQDARSWSDRVCKFEVRHMVLRTMTYYCPDIKATNFCWERNRQFNREIDQFTFAKGDVQESPASVRTEVERHLARLPKWQRKGLLQSMMSVPDDASDFEAELMADLFNEPH